VAGAAEQIGAVEAEHARTGQVDLVARGGRGLRFAAF
jgi:hypothetical protein